MKGRPELAPARLFASFSLTLNRSRGWLAAFWLIPFSPSCVSFRSAAFSLPRVFCNTAALPERIDSIKKTRMFLKIIATGEKGWPLSPFATASSFPISG
ncbi:MAG: hypothetical protein CL533_01665 [Afipia sp.]|nr:hypothetical protein [Afipia sp.]OUX62785.1 MAG: hypothetical protein CBB64_01660 [Afipia sp. TMED4]